MPKDVIYEKCPICLGSGKVPLKKRAPSNMEQSSSKKVGNVHKVNTVTRRE